MTLIFLDGSRDGEPDVEFDLYTPVTVSWPAYARSLGRPESVVLGGAGGYLELKFGAESGQLLELVLVSSNASALSEALAPEAFGAEEDAPIAIRHEASASPGAADQKLDLAPLAYLDALEIRLDERTPLRIVRGRRVSFGVLADDRIASVYVKCSESERELFLEASNP